MNNGEGGGGELSDREREREKERKRGREDFERTHHFPASIGKISAC